MKKRFLILIPGGVLLFIFLFLVIWESSPPQKSIKEAYKEDLGPSQVVRKPALQTLRQKKPDQLEELQELREKLLKQLPKIVTDKGGQPMVKGELIVVLKEGYGIEDAQRIATQNNVTLKSFLPQLRFATFELLNDAQKISDPAIDYTENNYVMFLSSSLPNEGDPRYGALWNFYNDGGQNNYIYIPNTQNPSHVRKAIAGIDMGMKSDPASTADFIDPDCALVAVLDSGIDPDEPDMAQKYFINQGEIDDDNLDNDNNGYFDDSMGWNAVAQKGSALNWLDPKLDPYLDTTLGQDLAAYLKNLNDTYTTLSQDKKNELYRMYAFLAHGSAVSSVIAALRNNGEATAGLCSNGKILPVNVFRIMDDQGALTMTADVAVLAQAVIYAANQGAKVINFSGGAEWKNPKQSCTGGAQVSMPQTVCEAFKYAYDKGVISVVSAGNDGVDTDQRPYFPANLFSERAELSTITVGAIDPEGNRALWGTTGSNYGKTSVTLGAPGIDVHVAMFSGLLEDRFRAHHRFDLDQTFSNVFWAFSQSSVQDGYIGGTSFAAPHVAAVAAMVTQDFLNRDPSKATPTNVKEALMGGAMPLTSLTNAFSTGGIVQAAQSLRVAQGLVPSNNPPPAGQQTGLKAILESSDSGGGAGCGIVTHNDPQGPSSPLTLFIYLIPLFFLRMIRLVEIKLQSNSRHRQ